ncbi:MAG: hypothetical protein GAK28_03939 [Luteibacter sp.]|nr:MAG: hypothetical protein GAK28_03939 [Luteibacter sp.]
MPTIFVVLIDFGPGWRENDEIVSITRNLLRRAFVAGRRHRDRRIHDTSIKEGEPPRLLMIRYRHRQGAARERLRVCQGQGIPISTFVLCQDAPGRFFDNTLSPTRKFSDEGRLAAS